MVEVSQPYYRHIYVPEPFQHGVEDENIVYIANAGRWGTHSRVPMCPLQHPMDEELRDWRANPTPGPIPNLIRVLPS